MLHVHHHRTIVLHVFPCHPSLDDMVGLKCPFTQICRQLKIYALITKIAFTSNCVSQMRDTLTGRHLRHSLPSCAALCGAHIVLFLWGKMDQSKSRFYTNSQRYSIRMTAQFWHIFYSTLYGWHTRWTFFIILIAYYCMCLPVQTRERIAFTVALLRRYQIPRRVGIDSVCVPRSTRG
jgi:hypothetical protein